jgi:hypothetical protein
VPYQDFGGAPIPVFETADVVKLQLAPPGTSEEVCSVARVDTIHGVRYAAI